jgi:hypothetical protein
VQEILYFGGHRQHALPFRDHYPYQLDQGLTTADQTLIVGQVED